MIFRVEGGIAPPSRIARGHSQQKYPWDQMTVGDSVFVANGTTQNVGAAALKWGRKRGMRFTSSSVDGGVRVWRVS